jgi:hypothetical protein
MSAVLVPPQPAQSLVPLELEFLRCSVWFLSEYITVIHWETDRDLPFKLSFTNRWLYRFHSNNSTIPDTVAKYRPALPFAYSQHVFYIQVTYCLIA